MSDSRQQVRRVLLITLILNITVALGKIVVGAVSGAISITADGFH
jgi:divalent metal cation (Fe/Co/Zn/Cd) transporter